MKTKILCIQVRNGGFVGSGARFSQVPWFPQQIHRFWPLELLKKVAGIHVAPDRGSDSASGVDWKASVVELQYIIRVEQAGSRPVRRLASP